MVLKRGEVCFVFSKISDLKVFPGQNFARSRWGWHRSEDRDTAHIHREEHSLFSIPRWSLHYQVSWHFFVQIALCSLVNIAGILFIKCFDFHIRRVLLHGEHLLIFKDIFGLLNTSMGVLVGRDHRFYIAYTVYNHCERLASVGKGKHLFLGTVKACLESVQIVNINDKLFMFIP